MTSRRRPTQKTKLDAETLRQFSETWRKAWKGEVFAPGSAPKVRMKPQAAKLWRRLEKLGKARRARLCQS